MPPPVYSESESDGGEEVIMPRKPNKADPIVEENGEEEDEDIEGDEDETTYIVQAIRRHVDDKNQILYEVKWQGYDDSENTWEPEDNLEGAADILAQYFDKIGGRPEPKASKASSAKKRGRKSGASVVETPEPTSKKPKTGFEGRRGRPPKGESRNDLEWPAVDASDWSPPKPVKDAWEDLIVSIETIEVEENGTKWAFLLWAIEDENGKKRTSKATLKSVYTAAPQAMLKFYENHLVFTDANKEKKENQKGES